MTASPAVLDLVVSVDVGEARRYLGYPAGHPASARAAARLAALWAEAIGLLSPRGSYAVVGRDVAAATGMPDPSAQVGIAVCTIGPALEGASAARAAAGDMLDALVLDAIGSAAAEAAADALNLELCSVAAERCLVAAPRVSPGYGGWDTSAQRCLLALLPIAALGMSVTAGAMMVPRKSVSFAASFVRPGESHAPDGARCARCGLLRCRHRVAPADGG